ncbi:MAG: hypothetical protein K2H06_06130, partial [Anaeroplasmataceae bacterium]|nr:hypothetical protein [Anaeroplasmataceae bacterium]
MTTPLDYASYIRVPSANHVFIGFSSFNSASFVKIYVNTAKTGSACWYVYVSPRYETISFETSPNEPSAQDASYVLQSGEVLDHFELDQARSNSNYKLYVAVCTMQTASCNVSIQSTTEASLSFANPFTDSVSVSGILTDTEGNTKSFNTLTPSFTGLNPNSQYKVSGVITSSAGSACIEETTFSTNVATYLTSITEDQALRHVSEQSIEIDCAPYLNAIPAGYQLVGFQLINEAEEVLEEVVYTSDMETVYFTNLEANTKYAVRSCYS